MKRLLLLSFLLFLPTVQAYEGIFSILNESYVSNISELPSSTNLTPQKNVTVIDLLDKRGYFMGNLAGWIDILGFKDMARIDGIDYVNTTPEQAAIVSYDTSYLFSKRCGQCYLDKMVKNVSIVSSRNVTAWLNVTMRWYRVYWVWCGDGCEYPIYELHIDYLNISKSVPAPLQFHSGLQNITVYVTHYNNSLYENTGIKVQGDYTRFFFEGATRTLGLLHVENNSKGVVFGNLTHLDEWQINSTGASHFYDQALINGNTSSFDIRACDVFSCIKIDQSRFVIEYQEFKPWRAFNGLFIAVIGTVATLGMATFYLSRRLLCNVRLF